MGDPSTRPSSPPTPSTPPPATPVTLVQPSSKKKGHRPIKVFRVFRNVLRSFPIITPAACKLPSLPGGRIPDIRSASSASSSGTRVTGTIFGYRKGPVSLSVQENPRTLPMLVVELGAMQTNALQKELSEGMVRIALECEKPAEKEKTKLLEEPVWTMFCNGKKNGYGVRREATKEDLHVMEVLKAVSMGAGVLPPTGDGGGDMEMAYMRGVFERVVGSKDSETLYMLSPDGDNGPDLSIFFVRV
ncbi:hypothetical protein CASFOL_018608 [Castilleja foliolosa]|uniref:Protein MIZU-KUSSEI 1 n=1 Tax=Castilleja foliolosa TaxID=1961234 RepID=A0ABD3D569_9LAMI